MSGEDKPDESFNRQFSVSGEMLVRRFCVNRWIGANLMNCIIKL